MMKKSLLLAAALALPTGHTLAQSHENPFLKPSPLALHYPQFDKIQDTDFAPALDQGMAEQLAEVKVIAENPAAPSFDNTIVALEKSGQVLSRASTVLFSLLGADSNPARQKVQSDYAAKLAAHRDAISLNDKLFARIDSLYQQRDKLGLQPDAVRLIERYRLNFVRAGAQLNAAQKERMKAINAELAGLSAKFTTEVLAEVNDSAVVVDSKAELAGFSDEQIAGAAAAAKARGLPEGKYLIALLNTTGQPPLAQLENRALRERIFKASIARGSRGNAHDTTGIVARTMALRAERAQLLGFATYADFALSDQTAKNKEAVNKLLRQLAPAAVATARREGAEMQKLIDAEQAAKKAPAFKLAAWDWAFYSEKVRAAKFGFDESQLKPYLELNNVLENGVFYAANQLYGLTFKRRTDLPLYHPDIKVYDVFNADGTQLAIFIADMYARPSKRGGAWMNAYVSQSALLGELPVVANHLNIPKPPEGKPTLLTWDEVNTAFHEFGHALHGMFSNVRYPSQAGTAVPRDYVEYPSQVNEMWATWPQVLSHYAKHYQTGEAMPQALLDKVMAGKKFNQGFMTTEYLSASMLDQRWHQIAAGQVPTGEQAMAFEAKVLKEEGYDYEAVWPRYRTPYFSHVMSGYAAGYYGYIWAEVLDADTVEWFKSQGGLKRANGDTFRAKLLSRGGSEDAMEMFGKLVGHEPDIAPLLERRGMVLTNNK
ncbi:M3 family metallopeptidase [Pelomonas sp. KK5]|uniref:M3 family metallopeptidase n=1 Tax=Pelomonas sp. KK5 TaxID=1855730 RepID=UPI0018EA1492|nr:M3 family metallopeptidase [Pelomonas sp. KK5]